jgi:hypothetical protein
MITLGCFGRQAGRNGAQSRVDPQGAPAIFRPASRRRALAHVPNAPVAELVDALDSKSSSARSAGSIPARGTTLRPRGFAWRGHARRWIGSSDRRCRRLPKIRKTTPCKVGSSGRRLAPVAKLLDPSGKSPASWIMALVRERRHGPKRANCPPCHLPPLGAAFAAFFSISRRSLTPASCIRDGAG